MKSLSDERNGATGTHASVMRDFYYSILKESIGEPA
jgi:hypothetical protein